MRIHVLDKFTAELIAAGEVVERPASVVKELCENAIDAGAKNIRVEIERGGVSLIRVQDDGGGIEREDVPKAFLRHATSKVKEKEDLNCIHTLGFRGEALASIASVARVSLLTRTPQDEFALLYRIEGGEEAGQETAPGMPGTTIEVEELFYNTPARMKFLKKDASEGNYVSEGLIRLALSRPEISFTFIRDGKTAFFTPGDGKLASAVYACLGRDFAKGLVEVQANNGAYSVKGLITMPRAARASRTMQFFFMNGRYIKNRTIMAALEQAYRGLLMHGRFPGGVLFINMPPELVDVNVHPAKTEVRFAKEGDVFDTVYRGVKSALAREEGTYASLQLGQQARPKEAPAGNQQEAPAVGGVELHQAESPAPQPAFRPAQGEAIPRQQARAGGQMAETLFSGHDHIPYETAGQGAFPPERRLDIEADEAPRAATAKEAPGQEQLLPPGEEGEPLTYLGEAFKTYIIAQQGQRLCFIDKHAAHERMNYERLMRQRREPGVQQLLVPQVVTLGAAEKNALLANEEILLGAGIEAEDFGEGTVIVRGIPSDVNNTDISNLMIEIAGRLAANSKDNMDEKTQWVFHSVACRSAVKAGDKTSPQALLALAADILSGRVPPYCPHGRPVVIEITRKELEKQFGRLG